MFRTKDCPFVAKITKGGDAYKPAYGKLLQNSGFSTNFVH